MTYIACPFCGGGVPGVPCKCTTSLRPFDVPFSPMPVPSVETPPTPRENELLKRIKALEAENARLERANEALEQLRPVWAQGWTEDSMAAQASSSALSELWEMLGAGNQTQAVSTLAAFRQAQQARAALEEKSDESPKDLQVGRHLG